MIRVEMAAWSDIGKARELNEDRVFHQLLETSDAEPVALSMVADGMGGHLAGEVASHWAVETLKRELADMFVPSDPRRTVPVTSDEVQALSEGMSQGLRPSDVVAIRRLRKAVERANDAVRQYTLHRPQEAMGAGSTLTLALLRGKRAYVANVGDSRTYLLREGQMTQLTQDHSVVAGLVAAGQLTVEQAYAHPQGGLITRCLGYMDQVEVDITPHVLESRDCLLLCSDGLWEALREPTLMARIVDRAPDLDVAAHRLVEAANRASGQDNISVVLMRITEGPDIPT